MYCSRTDIENKLLPTSELVQLTDDESTGSANKNIDARIDAAIAQADTEIDGILLGLYPLPFDPVPQLITGISAKLAVYYLWSRRSGEKPDNVIQEYKWCQRKLDQIRAREIQLYAQAPVAGGGSLTNKTAADREFSRDRLDRMP